MTWRAQMGSALLMETGPALHLHIVCSNPADFESYPPASCLLVNVSSLVPKCDMTCVLQPGEHPFIVNESFVYFRKAKLMQASSLEYNVQHDLYKAQPSVDVALVRRIVANFDVSDETPEDMREIAELIWKQLFRSP